MANDNYGRLFYVNNFSNNRISQLVEERIPELIDYVLRTDEFSVNKYLCSLKDVYSYNNYMFILESIVNYLIKLYNELYFDLIKNNARDNISAIKRIKARYDNVMSIYEHNLDKVVDYNTVYKKTRFKTRKIYTNNLKRKQN